MSHIEIVGTIKEGKDTYEISKQQVEDVFKNVLKLDLDLSSTQLPDIDTYMKLKGFKFDKTALIGKGNKATVIYKNSDLNETVQIIKPINKR